MNKLEKSVVIGDLHIPYQDKKAVSKVLQFIQYFKPDNIFINGDLIDCLDISHFEKPLERHQNLAEEIEEAKYFLLQLRSIAIKSRIFYIFGNHEFRLQSYISRNARELYGLKGLTLEEQLGCKDLDIDVYNNHTKENYYQYGKLWIGHFNKINKHSGMTAKNLLEDKGVSIIQGHSHRLGSSYKRCFDGQKGGWEGGCLCDINPKYCNMPNWQLGCLTIHKDKKSDQFKVTPVEIIDNRIIYGDKII
jgi:UDP-2,3-diacylglucosamine pyrophosphatase LpxH